MDVEQFMTDGFVAIRGAVDAKTVTACQGLIWEALAGRGIHEGDPAGWPPIVHISDLDAEPFVAAGLSPTLVDAYDTLIGPGRWTSPVDVGKALAIKFPAEDRTNAGYHIEGSWDGPGGYWVNVRSRMRGLLALFLFGDVGRNDAPTRLLCGSHLDVPEFLAPHGDEGILADNKFWRESTLCRQVAHATGSAGDVFLCHPFIVHTATWPHRGTAPRMAAQPAVQVPEGFAVDGSDESPVARAIVTGLARSGVTRG